MSTAGSTSAFKSGARDLPLSGVRVVEMSHMVMGPSCGMVLSQLGADVIKVEPIGGDKTRHLKGMGISFFPLFSRGKESIELDTSSVSGQAELDRLLSSADVFIENFKDGTVATLGLDAATLRSRYPDLIICSHKGFLSGPYEHRPALDEVVQMMTGLAYMTGSRERPLRAGASVNDIMGGLFGVIGILAALLDRRSGKGGAEVRVGLFENCLFIVAQHLVQYQLTGVPVPPMSERMHAWPVYDIFETADHERLFVAVTTDTSWTAFCKTFDLEELLLDPGLQTVSERIAARERTIPVIAAQLRTKPLSSLEAELDALSIPFARISAPEDMLNDPHVLRSGGLVSAELPDGTVVRIPSLPIEFNGRAMSHDTAVPALGSRDNAQSMGAALG
ncbi:CoA transferase [Sphingobium sp.]|uniref:CaiB/BaiF CoA transferase family protein n=1 Tax=Sphingobium sp. TaxID=1912891 RepID=UPI0028BDCFB2|nr:CoA transferase [Sphingobium sp.]